MGRVGSKPALNRKHQEDLQRRGLKPEQIEAQRYRSVPLFGMKKLVKRLAEEGYRVKGVPGFYRDTDGNWTINFKAENSGILIPIVSLDGFIQGFQIRVDHVTDTKKYIWLSSVNYDQGVSSGSPVHVIGDLHAERVYLTEGALKGTIAHYLSMGVRLMVLELPTTLMDLSVMDNAMARMMLETINNMMLELYASMAQAELEKKEKRQREGIEAKKLRGEWDDYGRPSVMKQETFDENFQSVVSGETTPTQLRKNLGMTHSTFYRYRKTFYEKYPELSNSAN